MFNSNQCQSREVTTVTIRRVRNGFEMVSIDPAKDRGYLHDPYVFTELSDLFDFLVENDFECKDE